MQTVKVNHFFSRTVLLIFSLGVVLAVSSFWIMKDIENANLEHEFKYLMTQQSNAIQRELDLNLEVLRSIKYFYDSSKHVDRQEFYTFVQESLKNHESIQALEWIPKVKHSQREMYEAQASLDLRRSFSFKEKIDDELVNSRIKDFYYPVYYVEPLEGNEKVLGFDLSSSGIRMQSLNLALNNKNMIASAKIKLLQDAGESFGFLIFNPVWNKQNKNGLKGFILGVFKLDDIMKSALNYNKEVTNRLNIWLADVTHSRNNMDILYANATPPKNLNALSSKVINIEGRIWRLFAQPNKKFYAYHSTLLPHIVFISIVLITLLISYIIALRVSREESLKQTVMEKTTSIDSVNKRYETLLKMFDKRVIASKTDLSGKITYVTQAFCDISGYTHDELMGKNHNIVRHHDMPSSLYETLWRTIQSGQTFNGEIKNKRKDGTYYWVDAQIEPEYDDDFNIIGYIGVREDITAKKQIEEFNKTLANKIEEAVLENSKKDKLLLEQSKMAAMGEMIGAIAHQWRQPLNTLAIKIQFLEDDYEDKMINEAYLQEYTKESMQLINFMSKTIDDFRNFFTIDKEKTLFFVREKIEETTGILEIQLRNHKIELQVTGEDFELSGYPSEFQQVILNIVNNAKDALIEKEIDNGKISVSLDKANHIITIADNAGGIPDEVINRVFEPYFTTKEQGKGTGLGLYMSKMIIEDNMHGSIKVNNTDDGAMFTIQLGEIDE